VPILCTRGFSGAAAPAPQSFVESLIGFSSKKRIGSVPCPFARHRLVKVSRTDALALGRDFLKSSAQPLLIAVGERGMCQSIAASCSAFGFPWEGPILNIAGSSAFILSARLSLTSHAVSLVGGADVPDPLSFVHVGGGESNTRIAIARRQALPSPRSRFVGSNSDCSGDTPRIQSSRRSMSTSTKPRSAFTGVGK